MKDMGIEQEESKMPDSVGRGIPYSKFIESKSHNTEYHGFDPIFMPDFLFDFQRELTTWAIKKGRAAIFADCGLGKTPMQLVWAENVCRKENGNVLILTPLAVTAQTVREGEKFGINCQRCSDGNIQPGINISNYEQIHHLDPANFVGVVCDESSILKNFDGARKQQITEFMKKMPYRLLCTATAAPNDYIELGTSSEALGEMGHMDMLSRFFKNTQNTMDTRARYIMHGGMVPKWRFKKHAETSFWQWVCSWARAVRRPSDMGHSDNGFILPPLREIETIIQCSRPFDGQLFPAPAQCLREQRQERRHTLRERCEMAAMKTDNKQPAVVWCHLNDEGNLLEKIIPDAVQVSGSDSDSKKESAFIDFANGDLRVLVTKPKIGAFGLNWQHCSHAVFFPSHSYEQYYQGVRRHWRFGQKNPVTVDIITTEGELNVLKNLKRKSAAADKMFSELVQHMYNSNEIRPENKFTETENVPTWLSPISA